jgi:superfamily II helicase
MNNRPRPEEFINRNCEECKFLFQALLKHFDDDVEKCLEYLAQLKDSKIERFMIPRRVEGKICEVQVAEGGMYVYNDGIPVLIAGYKKMKVTDYRKGEIDDILKHSAPFETIDLCAECIERKCYTILTYRKEEVVEVTCDRCACHICHSTLNSGKEKTIGTLEGVAYEDE